MSDALRELVVSIDFDEINLVQIAQLQSALDEVEDQLQSVDHATNSAADELGDFATEGAIAAAVVATALANVEEQAEDVKKEIKLVNLTLIGSIAKYALYGAAGAGAFALITAAAAPLLAITMALAASLAAAALGVAAFGAVAIPVMTDFVTSASEIASIEEKIANADTAKARIKAQKELAAAYGAMGKEQRTALKELGRFKKFWGGFTEQFNEPVFKIFGTGLHILQELLKGLEPTIHAVASVIGELMDGLDKSISNSGFARFFVWLETNGSESLRNWATIAGNTIGGFMNMLMAFSPYGASFEETLVKMTDKFEKWSLNLSRNEGFKSFMDYAQTNGPVLWEVLKNIWQIFEDIVKAAAPLGTEVLNALQWLTDKALELTPYLNDVVTATLDFAAAVQDNWPAIRETVIGLTIAVGSFVGIMKALQIIAVINALMVAFKAGTLAATLAQYGLNTAMLLNPMTWVVAGIAALIAAGVLLYRNWDVVKVKMGEAWEFIKDATASSINGMIGMINGLIRAINKIPGVNIPLVPKIHWGDAEKAAQVGSGNINAAKMKQFDGSHASGLERVPFDGYAALLHRDEAVLTAAQSNALRDAGVLKSNGGGKPQITKTGGNTSPIVFSPTVKINVEGGGNTEDLVSKIKAVSREELENLFIRMMAQMG